MKQQEVIEFVIRELDQGRSCDEIVRVLCAQTGWPAKQIEAFVQRVEAGHRREVAKPAVSPSPPQSQDRVEVEPSERAARPATPQLAQSYPQHIEPEQHPEIVQAVVDALGKHQSRKLIVRSLCEQHGWPWKQAHHFVQRIEVEHHGQIATRQSPLLIALGLGILIIGALDLIYVTYLSLGGQSISVYGVPYAGNLGGFVTGIGMVLGGIAGIWRTISIARE
jgi:hypothetical protein